MKYGEKVLDHYRYPRNVGTLDAGQANVGTGLAGSPKCGDTLKLQIEVDPSDRIVAVRFKAFGCAAGIACGSLVTELIKGKMLDEALEISNNAIADELELPDRKRHCSVMAENAIRVTIEDLRRKRTRKPDPAAT